jgi:hypothetical protein
MSLAATTLYVCWLQYLGMPSFLIARRLACSASELRTICLSEDYHIMAGLLRKDGDLYHQVGFFASVYDASAIMDAYLPDFWNSGYLSDESDFSVQQEDPAHVLFPQLPVE